MLIAGIDSKVQIYNNMTMVGIWRFKDEWLSRALTGVKGADTAGLACTEFRVELPQAVWYKDSYV